jgi:hypothetical protein
VRRSSWATLLRVALTKPETITAAQDAPQPRLRVVDHPRALLSPVGCKYSIAAFESGMCRRIIFLHPTGDRERPAPARSTPRRLAARVARGLPHSRPRSSGRLQPEPGEKVGEPRLHGSRHRRQIGLEAVVGGHLDQRALTTGRREPECVWPLTCICEGRALGRRARPVDPRVVPAGRWAVC